MDNTIATPYLIQPLSQGADIVVHSATKYLGGHGTAVAGVIVDGGTFDWTSGKFPGFTTPDPSYHGVVFADLGAPAFALKARVQLLRDLGSAAAPFNAFLIAQGLETLSLRIERHVSNAQRVAEYLAGHDDVISVNYAGLPSSPWYERGRKLAPRGTGAVLSFELAGEGQAGIEKQGIRQRAEAAQPCGQHRRRAFAGDPSGLDHPPAAVGRRTTGHRGHPGLVRLAVGLEGIDDILADLERGFAAARSPGSQPLAVAALDGAGYDTRARTPADHGPPGRGRDRHRRRRSTAPGERRSARRRVDRDPALGRTVSPAGTTSSSCCTPSPGIPTCPAGGTGWPVRGAPVDTNRWCAVATNVLGGCRGSTGPSSLARDGRPWGSRFPLITVRDQVNADVAALAALGIPEVAAVIGGSMGGARALEWMIGYPDRVGAGLVLAVGARATADQIGTQSTQIAAIKSDPNWQGGNYYGTGRSPDTGLGWHAASPT